MGFFEPVASYLFAVRKKESGKRSVTSVQSSVLKNGFVCIS